MHNIFLVARREYLERVRAKSFLIMTVLIPLLMGALVGGAALVNRHTGELSRIAVITDDKTFAANLGMDLSGEDKAGVAVETYSPTDTAARTRLDAELLQKDGTLDGYLVMESEGAARPAFDWHPKAKADVVGRARLADAIRSALTREALGRNGMGTADVNALLNPIKLETPGVKDTSSAAFGSAYGMFFLMYFVILFYGMNVARSIIEEKTSRVFEVLLATIRPEEMLAGKVIGVGAVGLTQVGIWILCAVAAIATGIKGIDIHILPSATQAVFFVVFFLLGYLLYSSIAAALGAMTNSEQELQQLNMFLVIPLAFCMVMIFAIIRAPDSGLATVISLIPFCSPLLMNFRISLTHVPPWQINLSIMLMSLTVGIILWAASRVYRVGILMYGKKPNLPEIIRWMKYS